MVSTADKLRVNIRAIAKAKRIGTYELADEAGMHYDTLNKFLQGKTKSAPRNLERIADALGFTVVGLINYRVKS